MKKCRIFWNEGWFVQGRANEKDYTFRCPSYRDAFFFKKNAARVDSTFIEQYIANE